MTYLLPVWLWRLATAEIAESPRSIAEHAQLAAVTKQIEEWSESTLRQNIVTARWAVTSNVTESPDSLFPHIRLMAAEKLDKDGYGASLDDDLCLLGGAGSDVGESPGSFELHEGMRRLEELDKAADNAGCDHALDGRVALLG